MALLLTLDRQNDQVELEEAGDLEDKVGWKQQRSSSGLLLGRDVGPVLCIRTLFNVLGQFSFVDKLEGLAWLGGEELQLFPKIGLRRAA